MSDSCQNPLQILLNVVKDSKNDEDLQSSLENLLVLLDTTSQAPDKSLLKQALETSLSHRYSRIRCLGLELASHPFSSQVLDATQVLSHYTTDLDWRVRTAAFDRLNSLENPNLCLQAFEDANEEVQIAAMKCFVRNNKTNHDFAMVKLGLQAYSNQKCVVLEALDLMSKLRPSVKTVNGALSMEDTSVGGFLLNLLESESCDVRLAVLNTTGCLLHYLLNASKFESIKSLVYKTVKILLDAINDEFQEVRVKVFEFLSTLTPHFFLEKKLDLESCIFNLRDSDPMLRHAIYDFLCRVKIKNSTDMLTILETLYGLFNKFPEDKDYIFSVSASMARKNTQHAKSVSNKLLNIDKRFLHHELNWNEPVYVAKLIFTINARGYVKNLGVPSSLEKHISYISDLYPIYMPIQDLQSIEFAPIQQSEFTKKAKCLTSKLNKLVLSPQCYLGEAQLFIQDVLHLTCELQHCFNVHSPLVTDFLIQCRLQAHLLLLLSFLSEVHTGKFFSEQEIKQQVQNVWRIAAVLRKDHIVNLCHNITQEATYLDKFELYKEFKSSLCQVALPPGNHDYEQKEAKITYPFGEVVVSECDMLSIQGIGQTDVYSILEFPDGSVESAKTYLHGGHLTGFIRIHKPNSPLSVLLCLAYIYNLHDIEKGPGLYHKTLNMQPYIPISEYSQLTLKPN